MKPRLRPHVQTTRQHYRGQRWHVVHDPGNNQFYRLNPVAYECVGLLDGRRTVEEVWQLALTRHGDSAPTQHEFIQLISQLYNSNLLSIDNAPEVDQLLRRGEDRRNKKIKQQAMSLMFFKVRLFNPDRILGWIEPVLRPVINRVGLAIWALAVVAALVAVAPHYERLISGIDTAIAPANWFWIGIVFVVTKLIHETGHGVICKRFGGQVPETGVMLLVLFPAPYVDASSAWGFESKWRRIAVGAGGMIFELAVAAVAAFVWLNSQPGDLVHQLAYNAMFTASISTVLFNANPLMRFDGYYMLSDWLEMPNLMQRSNNMLKHLCLKYIYRIKDTNPPSTARDEQIIFVVYGILGMAYRVFLFITITLYVMGKFFAVGLFLAIWSVATWFLVPAGMFVHWLATNNKLADFRGRAVATSLALIVLAVVLFGLIPWPDHRRGDGVVTSTQRSGVFAGVDGFLDQALARPGDFVKKGDPIAIFKSPELQATRDLLDHAMEEAVSFERMATARNPAAAIIARERLDAMRDQQANVDEQLARLIVRAPHDGYVVGKDPATLIGSFLKEGEEICVVADPKQLRITAAMSQTEVAWLQELPTDKYHVEMRLVSNVDTTFEGEVKKIIEAGQVELPHAALGFQGGGQVETAQNDQTGREAKRPHFEVHVIPVRNAEGSADEWPGAPGERVKLRFTLPSRPLLSQWVDRLQKVIQGKVDL
jgi:putative peptide zinc metalloprotease protein